MLIRSKRLFCIACLLYLAFAPQTLLSETEYWHYKLTPYLWNVSFYGDTSSVGNGRYGILLDGLRARYSDTASNRIFDSQLSVEIGFVEGAIKTNWHKTGIISCAVMLTVLEYLQIWC